MDNKTEQQAIDATLEKELLTNERIVEHPTLGRIKFSRPTPRQQSLIAEERRKQQHTDLKDEAILSRAELEKIAVRRGMWSPEEEKEVTELSRKVGELMGILDAIGYRSLESLLLEFNAVIEEIKEQFPDNVEVLETIERYFDLDGERSTRDRTKIFSNAESTEVDELLDRGDSLRKQIDLLIELGEVRQRLNALQEKQANLFVDSIEARSHRAERLASLYYCARREDGTAVCGSLENFKDFTADEIEFLMSEYFYFEHGITEEFKAILGRHGFINRLTDTEDSSDDSLDQPQSNSDGESQDSERTSSGESTDTES